PGGLRRRAARGGRRDGGLGERRPVDPVPGRRRRPRGDALRGAARREGDVRVERLAAREPTRAGARVDRPPAGPDPPRGGGAAAPARRMGAGARGDLSVRARVPRRLAGAHRDRDARRQQGPLAVRRAAARARRAPRDRALVGPRLERGAARGARRRGADGPSGLPEPALAAVPHVRAARERAAGVERARGPRAHSRGPRAVAGASRTGHLFVIDATPRPREPRTRWLTETP